MQQIMRCGSPPASQVTRYNASSSPQNHERNATQPNYGVRSGAVTRSTVESALRAAAETRKFNLHGGKGAEAVHPPSGTDVYLACGIAALHGSYWRDQYRI